ncbi:MAG: 50S ribosomal protein L13 [Patescibacteria group bacterium]|nr:50S ribosomal protein L13 [Patescibacteria group bacterium]
MSEKLPQATKHISHLNINRDWYLFDASDYRLGRLAAIIASLLIGKKKANQSPHLDMGDGVVVVNAGRIKVTGRKKDAKIYYRHSGYIGNLKAEKLSELLKRDSREVIKKAVKNMLPKNRHQDDRMRRLRVFKGVKHDLKEVIFKKIEDK